MELSTKQKIRSLTFLIISILCFSTFWISLFYYKALILGSIFFVLFYLFIAFVAFEKYHQSFKKIILIVLIFIVILSFFITKSNWHIGLSMFFALSSVPAFYLFYRHSLKSGITFNVWRYFSEGISIFLLFFTAIIGFSLLGNFQTLPLHCEDVTNRTAQASLHLIQHDSPQTSQKKNGLFTEISSFVSDTKNLLRDNVIATQRTLNYKICSIILGQLQILFQIPAFQLAFLAGLYMLSYGILNFFLYIIAGLGVFLFWLCRFFGGYQISKKLVEAEQID